MRSIALFILFGTMNLLWLMADNTWAGNNGPTYLSDQATPFMWLTLLLQPWLCLVLPAIGWLALVIGEAAFIQLQFHGASLLAVAITSLLSVAAYSLIGRLVPRVAWLSRIAARIPRRALVCGYLVLLAAYSAMCIYVAVSISRYVYPDYPS